MKGKALRKHSLHEKTAASKGCNFHEETHTRVKREINNQELCLYLKIECRLSARGRQRCGIFHNH